MMKGNFFVLLAALLCLLSFTSAQIVFIDDFLVQQSDISVPADQTETLATYVSALNQNASGPQGHIIENIRKMRIVGVGGGSPYDSTDLVVGIVAANQNDGQNGIYLDFSNAQKASGFGHVVWDAGTNPSPFVTDTEVGLGPLDLTQLGSSFYTRAASDIGGAYSIIVYSPGGGISYANLTIPSGGVQVSGSLSFTDTFVAYTQFTGNANFKQVAAIELYLAAEQNLDALFDVIALLFPGVSGTVYSDCGCNLIASSSTPLSGVSVTITAVASPNNQAGCSTFTPQSQTTNSLGQFNFTNIPFCVYQVTSGGQSSNGQSLQYCNNANSQQTDITSSFSVSLDFFANAGGSLTVPPSVTIPCTTSTAPNANSPVGIATGGNCGSGSSGSSNVTYTDSISKSGSCANNYVITRTYTLNGQSKTQTITVTDAKQAPSISCPSSLNVVCGANTSPAATGSATGVDACSGNAATITSADTTTSTCNQASCTMATTINRVFTATDGCGNTASCTQTITQNSCGATVYPTPSAIHTVVPVTPATSNPFTFFTNCPTPDAATNCPTPRIIYTQTYNKSSAGTVGVSLMFVLLLVFSLL